MEENSPILTEMHDGVYVIILNRPKQKNAFNKLMIDQWVEALENAKRNEDIKVILITGNESAFCSGGDLNDMKADLSPAETKDYLWRNVHRVALTIHDIDKPIICAINGIAVGAGLDMALMADIRIMAETAKVSEGYINVGLIPGDGGAYYLPRIVGYSKALELLWSGDFISASEAKEIGLVNMVYPSETFFEKSLEYAKRIAAKPQIAVRLIKRTVKQSIKSDLSSSLDLVSSHFAIVKSSEDHKEAVNAFLQKRKPIFTGK
ncbi:enoyl-CoA hydratase/isomerase family protein [Neobacillus rhizophilus]|uniref:Enoyl-CoA hydratase n=1 Tax=Neobacillus rhizophilus TaxID=2833579 RepID=A0A942UBC4_9BACI|nr:enoyl-CoA hydratase [Neobacillus rhizophilus]MBS4214239.1 enoyl-CoA hydratase [Neobacillus rhizophilus]MBU8915972.1 enoyl-CoA hydratase [Bacillus sp. FJAT-29953]